MAKIFIVDDSRIIRKVLTSTLKEAGHEVIGVTLRTTDSSYEKNQLDEIADARETADILGIQYHTVDVMSEFKCDVVKHFVNEYISGRTPNPCVVCNTSVKWQGLIDYADLINYDFVATGHYAEVLKLDNKRFALKQLDNNEKDQTYMLYRLTQDQLKRTYMPLYNKTKPEVRSIAEKIGLKVFDKPDSQEICFVPDGKYPEFVENFANGYKSIPGDFVDEDGNYLGKHKGIIHYTVGQRKGLGIAMGYPVFVKEIRPDTNEIVLAEEESLLTNRIYVRDICFMGLFPMSEGEKVECFVKIRYHHKKQKANVTFRDNGFLIEFEEPVRAASPGQSAVLYDDKGFLLGGGIIDK